MVYGRHQRWESLRVLVSLPGTMDPVSRQRSGLTLPSPRRRVSSYLQPPPKGAQLDSPTYPLPSGPVSRYPRLRAPVAVPHGSQDSFRWSDSSVGTTFCSRKVRYSS